MNAGVRLLLALLVVCFLLPSSTRADGKAFKRGGQDSAAPFRFVYEHAQSAIIAHKDGRQQMLLRVAFDLEEPDAGLWIVPVPGTPETVNIAILDQFPRIRGYDPRTRLQTTVNTTFTVALATQVHLLPVIACFPSLGQARSMHSGRSAEVHDAIERFGLRMELVTAKSIDELAAYLEDKQSGVHTPDLASFAPYLDGKHVLTVTWIKSHEELLKEYPNLAKPDKANLRAPALAFDFPTPAPFFPLRPSHIPQGDDPQPRSTVELFILGHVTADKNPYHLRGRHLISRDGVEFSGQTSALTAHFAGTDMPYTWVMLFEEPASFKDDLFFTPAGTESRMLAAHRLVTWFEEPAGMPLLIVMWVAAVAGLSYLSAGLAGRLLLGGFRGYALYGLANVLTIAAVYIALIAGQSGRHAIAPPKRLAFLGLFSVCFLVGLCVLFFAVTALLSFVLTVML